MVGEREGSNGEGSSVNRFGVVGGGEVRGS